MIWISPTAPSPRAPRRLQGCSPLQRHIRRLLDAWAAGASGPQVAAMAGNQTCAGLVILAAEAAAILVLLAGSAAFAPPPALLTLGTGLMVLVALIAIARFQLASQTAGYIESHLLARIGNDTPAAAGVDFAQTALQGRRGFHGRPRRRPGQVRRPARKSQARPPPSSPRRSRKPPPSWPRPSRTPPARWPRPRQEAAAPIAKAHQEAAAQVVKAQQESVAQIVKTQT
jgi:hypothetical protein